MHSFMTQGIKYVSTRSNKIAHEIWKKKFPHHLCLKINKTQNWITTKTDSHNKTEQIN